MPDYFVPLDTTNAKNNFLGKLYSTNVIREFTLNYYEDNRAKLDEMDYQDFYDNYEVSDKMMKKVISMAKEEDVEYNEEEYLMAQDRLRRQIKGLIARSIWGHQKAWPIYNQSNTVLQEALQLFDQAEKLASR